MIGVQAVNAGYAGVRRVAFLCPFAEPVTKEMLRPATRPLLSVEEQPYDKIDNLRWSMSAGTRSSPGTAHIGEG